MSGDPELSSADQLNELGNNSRSKYPNVDYRRLPKHIQGGMRRYIEDGIPPGGFALAVLENDLVSAFQCADRTNSAALSTWVKWLWRECPSAAWGSIEKVERWMFARRQEAIVQEAVE